MVERSNTGLGIAHVELLIDLHELDEHVFIVLGRRCRDVYAGDHVDTAEMKLMTKVSLFSMVAGADLYAIGFPDVGVFAVFQDVEIVIVIGKDPVAVAPDGKVIRCDFKGGNMIHRGTSFLSLSTLLYKFAAAACFYGYGPFTICWSSGRT